MKFKLFLKNEKGVSAVEYAIIIGVIALFTFVAWKNLGKVLEMVVKKIILKFLW